jgi:hypothetical protein
MHNYNDREVRQIVKSVKSLSTDVNDKPRFHEKVDRSELVKSLNITLSSLRDPSLCVSVKRYIAEHVRTLRETLNGQGNKNSVIYNFNPKNP